MSDQKFDIERRAYELWEQAGKPEERAADFWLAAERELADGASASQLHVAHILHHMQVISIDHKMVGRVDRMEGADTIKLTRESSPGGNNHHFVPVKWIDHVDQHVHLNRTGQEILDHWILDPAQVRLPD
jgi:hypothetical protein